MKQDLQARPYFSGNKPDSWHADRDELISPRDLLARIWRGRRTVALCAVVCALIAAVAVSRMEPRFRASADVMFAVQSANVIDIKQILADPEFTKDTLQNEIEVLQSTRLLERVVVELGLRDDPEFRADADAGPGLPARLAGALEDLPRPEWLPAAIDRALPAVGMDVPTDPAGQDRRDLLRVIGQLHGMLALTPVVGTRVLEISATSRNPETAARIVNTVAAQYLNDQLSAKESTTRDAVQWLDGRVREAQERLREAEQAVEAMRTRLSESAGQSLALTEQQLAALNATLSEQRARTSEIEARHVRLKSALDGTVDMGAMAEFRESPLIRDFRATEAEVVSRLDALSANHPARAQLEVQLREARARARAEAEAIVAAVGIERATARGQEEALTASVRALETKGLGQSRDEVQLHQLEREAEASRQIYETMLNRLKETSEQVDLHEPNARVLSPAEIPLAPESSRKMLIVAMAGMSGLFGGICLIFLRDQFDETFRAPQLVQRLTGLPVLAVIPLAGIPLASAGRRREDIIAHLRANPTSGFAESIRHLRTSILLRAPGRPPKVVMFTSSIPVEGKSTTAMLTALTTCQTGRSVIIVDCDLRQPCQRQTIRTEAPAPGLLSVLDGSASLDEAIRSLPDSPLRFLTAGPGDCPEHLNPADLLASDAFRELIDALSRRHDLVILDSPPTLLVSDARILATIADAVVHVVRWNATPRAAVLDGLADLASVKAPVIGVVLSMADEAKVAEAESSLVSYRDRYRNHYRKRPERRRRA